MCLWFLVEGRGVIEESSGASSGEGDFGSRAIEDLFSTTAAGAPETSSASLSSPDAESWVVSFCLFALRDTKPAVLLSALAS